ncbi:MAG: hypothetical protein AB8B35_07560, partial [Prochlorococcus sp.]
MVSNPNKHDSCILLRAKTKGVAAMPSRERARPRLHGTKRPPVAPAEAMDFGSVVLGEDVEKGLVPAQVSFIKESTLEINEELMTAGQCLRAVASHLHQIKQNVRPGNWKAFLRSGAIKCSPR